MNGKFALALILTLQVSMSLAEIPPPSKELVDKYESMKATFYRRVLNAVGKVQQVIGPMVADQDQGPRQYMEDMQTSPKFQGAVKIATGLAQEASPLLEKARLTALGAYEYYLRPYIGEPLDNTITHAKVILDKFMPAE